MSQKSAPTLCEWVGGIERIETLFMKFYERVTADAVLAPVFSEMPSEHFRTVAHFVAEVLGGPKLYSGDGKRGHSTMVAKHLARHLTEQQRKCWMELLLDTADQLGLPNDPEFRSALVGYLEWALELRLSIPPPPSIQLIKRLRCQHGAGARSKGRTLSDRRWPRAPVRHHATILPSPRIFATVKLIELARIVWAERLDEPPQGGHLSCGVSVAPRAAHVGLDHTQTFELGNSSYLVGGAFAVGPSIKWRSHGPSTVIKSRFPSGPTHAS
jgi:hemoglobin